MTRSQLLVIESIKDEILFHQEKLERLYGEEEAQLAKHSGGVKLERINKNIEKTQNDLRALKHTLLIFKRSK